MNRRMKKLLCVLLAGVLAAGMTGCTGSRNEEKTQSPTLPPAVVSEKAPDGDRTVREARDYTIYLPERNDLQPSRSIHLEEANLQDTAETLVRSMLDMVNGERAAQGENRKLSLYQDSQGMEAPLEISGGICTVNLDPSVLQMTYSERYKLCIALATTLCAMEEIHGVNLLTAGQSAALDVTGTLAMGTLTAHPGEDLQVLWEQMEGKRTPLGEDGSKTPMSTNATIYYPLPEGRGMICESKMIYFDGQTANQMASALLEALSESFRRKYGSERTPALAEYLLHTPVTSELKDGGKLITIDFRENIQEMLDQWGTDLPCLVAAVAATLTTFIPGVAAVKMRIGDNPVTETAGDRFPVQKNPGGMVYRESAEVFLMGTVTVFFEKDGRLTACEIPVDRHLADSPRVLLQALLDGPDRRAAADGMKSTMPDGAAGEDILGIAAEGDTLLVNMSANFLNAVRDAGPEKEELLCYSMVNTLCLNSGMKRVCFFFGEKQAETIAGDIYWGGEFIYNPGV